ncbi:carboxypeptidase A2 [Ixodes scapularis]|uniref:carboxypeptidase A2 n=1 Tax=Ixodes scapularis TaxID=6945 RepID=UPI001C388368|nr:carboxypeptidase A2 [Ixodes scapularis]
MESSGMQYHIKTDNLQSLINAEKHLMVPDEQVDSSQEPSSEELFDFSKYHSYKAVTRSLSAYAKAHSFVQLQTIGQTHDDNDIVAVRVARRQALPVILIDCGIHAREWVTISACMYIINELIGAEAPGSNISSIVNSYEWWVIPCLNPDGYEFSRKKNRLWRKNRSLQYSFNGTRCAGTDLNRNFDVSFCSGQDEADPCKETFCGKAPFSEPETHAFRELVAELRNRIAFYFSLHAFGDLWLIPYSFRVERPPDYDELMARATRAVRAIKTLSGETYKAGPVSSMLYLAPGTAIDWMYVKKSIRMSFTVEVSGEKVGFLLSQSEIARTSKQVWTGVLAVVQ